MQFHLMSFEGPDAYAQAGGIASRISGFSESLAAGGFPTHLWYVGDPSLPGHETRGALTLHRWCQWISKYHPGGVYDGEEGKHSDYSASLPPYLWQKVLLPHLSSHASAEAIILAEEWQTVAAVLHLDQLLRSAGVRSRVRIFWNANNVFGFDRIDWRRLAEAAIITTVSRFMRHEMWKSGVDPIVIPNGLTPDAFEQPETADLKEFRRRLGRRMVLGKVARWDPDKRWLLAIDTLIEAKRQGWNPLLVARGGAESHGEEVMACAAKAGLRVTYRTIDKPGTIGLLESLEGLSETDVLVIESHLDSHARRLLFRAADAILANSGREPFGLVGLEAMAVGGLACTGATGEDYVISGWNSLVLQTNDPHEFIRQFQRLRERPAEDRDIRRRAKLTARQYAWEEIIRRNLIPRLGLSASRADMCTQKYSGSPDCPTTPQFSNRPPTSPMETNSENASEAVLLN